VLAVKVRNRMTMWREERNRMTVWWEKRTQRLAVAVKHPDKMYQAVRSVMEGGQDPMRLNPRMKYYRKEDLVFRNPGDERILHNANMCNIEGKMISSASFDPCLAIASHV
jgi:hypothetical protein